MFKKSFIAVLTAASLMSSASAAELGSFLLKLQGGYAMSNSSFNASANNASSTIKNNNLNGFQGLVGFGYVASEDIWTDVTVSYDVSKTSLSSANQSINQVQNNNMTGMLNAYYGFNMGHSFSPYVMCGLGMGISKSKISLPVNGPQFNGQTLNIAGQLSSNNSTYFAYQGGFGMTFEMMKSIALDLGYRIGNGQTAKTTGSLGGGSALVLSPQNQLKQSVLLGINVAF